MTTTINILSLRKTNSKFFIDWLISAVDYGLIFSLFLKLCFCVKFSCYNVFFIPSDGYLFLKQCIFSFETKNSLDRFKGGPKCYERFFSTFSGKETGAFQSTLGVGFNEFRLVYRARQTKS